MKRRLISPEEFVKVYNECVSLYEVAERLNMTHGSARTLSTRYRNRGLIKTKKKPGRKNVAK